MFSFSIIFSFCVYYAYLYSIFQLECAPSRPKMVQRSLRNFLYYQEESLPLVTVKLAFEEFIHNVNTKKVNFNFTTYFEQQNNILKKFHVKSPLSHPNIFIDKLNNCIIAFPSSHKPALLHYKLFTNPDFIGIELDQYLSNIVYFYDPANKLQLNLTDPQEEILNLLLKEEKEFFLENEYKYQQFINKKNNLLFGGTINNYILNNNY